VRALSENRPNIRAIVSQVFQGGVPESGRGQMRGYRLDAGCQRDAHFYLLSQTYETGPLPRCGSSGIGIQDSAILWQW